MKTQNPSWKTISPVSQDAATMLQSGALGLKMMVRVLMMTGVSGFR